MPSSASYVDLYWLPLGAGDNTHCVRVNGRLYEWGSALIQRRERCDLYHSALEVCADRDRFTLEMAPVWSVDAPDRGVVCQGPVGLSWLGRWSLFRYEVRCWRNGTIPDLSAASSPPQRLGTDSLKAQLVLALVSSFPTATWGRDEFRTGDMWNSNSLIAWLLARSGHDLEAIRFPVRGRAPGWDAGLAVARRPPSQGDWLSERPGYTR